MSFFTDTSKYQTTIFNDDMSGTPDNWTNKSGATHSYASSQLTFTDDDVLSSELITASVISINRYKLIQLTWKWTSGNSTPVVFQFGDATDPVTPLLGVGCYIDFSTNNIFARDGSGWTSTSQTLATNTLQDLEFVMDTTLGTYRLYMNGTFINTYTIDTGTTNYIHLIIGGGSTAATEVYVFSKVLLKEGLQSTPGNYVPHYIKVGNGESRSEIAN